MSRDKLGMGFRIGHWTDHDAETGCTVVIPPRGNVTSCDIRGSSPGSRELEQLHPDRRLTEIHGLLLTGGSAHGLAAADGVMRWLESKGIGYETPVGLVPIVPSAVIFDLGSGRADVRPGPQQGLAACESATHDEVEVGRVGAGTGATAGKWAGREYCVPGGLGMGRAGAEGAEVAALAVVNPVGDVIAEDGSVIAGTTSPAPRMFPPLPEEVATTNTVLCVVVAQANVDKRDARWIAGRASDGVTKAIRPAHTRYDGDVAFACIAPLPADAPPPNVDVLGALATDAVAAAIRNAVLVAPPR